MNLTISPLKSIPKNIALDSIASDKSISHRAVIFCLLSKGENYISNFLFGKDCLHSLRIAIQLGAQAFLGTQKLDLDLIDKKYSCNQTLTIIPPDSLKEPNDILYCGNAGTAMRLYAGLLSGNKGHFILSGDKYLNIRPMQRIIKPLNDIGAKIRSNSQNTAPLSILGSTLNKFSYFSPISSAQVKSAMILSALQSNGICEFEEISKSRDHTEKMLLGMGAEIDISKKIIIHPLKQRLKPLNLSVPADPSSAFFFAVLALILKTNITLNNVLLNDTRIEAFKILEKMGAIVEIKTTSQDYEAIGSINIAYKSKLNGISIDKNIAWLIDEIPALAVIFAFCDGKSEIKNAKELRKKECDRIRAVAENLVKLGVKCEEKDDGFIIYGKSDFKPKNCQLDSFGDHRIAMSFALFGAVCDIELLDSACISVSFPNFLDIFANFSNVCPNSQN